MKRLIDVVIENFALDHRGIHGVSHWARVMLNGEMLHRHHPEIDLHVVKLFAVLHDCKRVCDSGDHDHGIRAADWLVTQNNILFKTTPIQLSQLVRACRYSQLSRLSSKYYYIRKHVDKIGTLILISSVIASAFIASLVRYL